MDAAYIKIRKLRNSAYIVIQVLNCFIFDTPRHYVPPLYQRGISNMFVFPFMFEGVGANALGVDWNKKKLLLYFNYYICANSPLV